MPGRTDHVTDPGLRAALLLARRGQAYFSRLLVQLSDAAFADPSLVAGWDRSHVVAHVGLHARALTRLTEEASTGVRDPLYGSEAELDRDVALAATLPVQALRNLSAHAAVHLNVEWRDLPEPAWAHVVETDEGEHVPVAATVAMRAREVWTRGVDLGNGGRFTDIPVPVLTDLLQRALARWPGERGLVAEPTDAVRVFRSPGVADDPVVLRGSLAALTRWATGRGSGGVLNAAGGPVPVRRAATGTAGSAAVAREAAHVAARA